MKARLFLLAILAFITAIFLAFSFQENFESPRSNSINYKAQKVIGCNPDWEELETFLNDVPIPPIEGSGTHKWKISTQNDSAQFYFNQGINMYYSFHIIESMASFKKAEQFDPANPMLPWAQALAYGPNINNVGYSASPKALEAVKRAVSLIKSSTSPVEKALIDAMTVRYSDDPSLSQSSLNQHYVDKMNETYKKFSKHADVAALYADAMMLQHPWDLWNINGTPKEWIPKIREVLEKLLALAPNHPGANHYYIHVMEPSPFFAKALPSAERLGKITPSLSHTVHMPSHIYLRTGHYDKGVAVNEDAVNGYKKILSLYAPVTADDFLYVIHNLHMKTNNAMLAGRSSYSIESALATGNSVPVDYQSLQPQGLANYIQYIYMTPMLVNVRFGKWDDILTKEPPGKAHIYATILYHFGRGMAHTGLNQLNDAEKELASLQTLLNDSSLVAAFSPFSSAIDGATVAEQLLKGNILLKKKNYNEAITAFEKAVNTEENMVYNEPRDWMLNPAHWLGNALLLANKKSEAEKVFRKDLSRNNENVWSLKGLELSIAAQRKTEIANIRSRLQKATKNADIRMMAPIVN